MPSQRRKVNLLGLSSERRYNSAIWSSEISRLSRLGIAILPRWPSSCMSGFISWPGRRPNRSLNWPADPVYSRNHCQGAFEGQRPPGTRATAAGFEVPPPVPATRNDQWRDHSGGRQPVWREALAATERASAGPSSCRRSPATQTPARYPPPLSECVCCPPARGHVESRHVRIFLAASTCRTPAPPAPDRRPASGAPGPRDQGACTWADLGEGSARPRPARRCPPGSGR